jgi:hypothetical protein
VRCNFGPVSIDQRARIRRGDLRYRLRIGDELALKSLEYDLPFELELILAP